MRVTNRRASHSTCRILIPAKLPARCSGYRSSDYMFSVFECGVMVFVFLRDAWRTAHAVPKEKVLSMCRARDAVPLKDVNFFRAPSHDRLFLQLLHYPYEENTRVSQRERDASSFVVTCTKTSWTADEMKKECHSTAISWTRGGRLSVRART